MKRRLNWSMRDARCADIGDDNLDNSCAKLLEADVISSPFLANDRSSPAVSRRTFVMGPP
jgi:hypothetical protein